MDRQSVFCVPINDKATRYSGGGDTRKDDGAGNGLGVGHNGEPSPTLTAADRHGVYCAGFKLGNSEQARSIGYQEEQSPTLNAECGGNKPAVVYSFDSLASNSMKSPNPKSGCREVDTARTLDTTSPDPSKNQGGIAILDMSHANDVIRECGDVVPTLQSRMGTGGNQVPLTFQQNGFGDYKQADVASACKQRDYKDSTDLCNQYGIVRRLTPTECERLQGFPDSWTDIGAWTDEKGKLHKESSDSARYRALGNSIALPPWKWVLKRLCAQYERDATLGSLFDGLGGFPLIWMQLNGWSSVKWASEIEPFCIAVTKRHFGDEKNPGDAWKYLIGAQKDG
jgi:DNA (cytosine-5)-methyltransferase 1